MAKSKIKNPYRLSFKDVLSAAIGLVGQEHLPHKPCPECKRTIALLKEVKKRLNDQAIGSNLVWYACKGIRKIDVK